MPSKSALTLTLLLLVVTVGQADAKPATVAPRSQVFYANVLDASAGQYRIGRYTNGLPDTAPPVVAARSLPCSSATGLAWPSVTRDASGTYFMYATEWDCAKGQWDHLVVFKSADGLNFTRAGVVIQPPNNNVFGSSYVVYDQGIFRAWYVEINNGVPSLIYAESLDGVTFTRQGSPHAGVAQIDYVFRTSDGTWHLLYTKVMPDGSFAGAQQTFTDPRQDVYQDAGVIVTASGATTTLTADSTPGAVAATVNDPGRFYPGEMVVIGHALSDTDVTTVAEINGATLTLGSPLRLPHTVGDILGAADSRKISPSYVCQQPDGSWAGIFSVFEAVPQAIKETTLRYTAPILAGPWTVDATQTAPALSLMRDGTEARSVENPTPVTASPAVDSC